MPGANNCTNALVKDRRTESLHHRGYHNSKSEWCSIYNGKGNKDACKRSFILYDTNPRLYQTCTWNGRSLSDDFSCNIDPKLNLCDDIAPPPPSPPQPPQLPSPPFAPPPPVLCAASAAKVSIRDLPSPLWCTDLAADHGACENAYVRMGETYVPCLYHPVDAKNAYQPTCVMSATKLSCNLSPPAPPAPPSVPAICAAASVYGYEQDLRYTANNDGNLSDVTTAAWNLAHHITSRDIISSPTGATNYARCELYRDNTVECKRSYQSDGDVWWPCIFKKHDAAGPGSCKPSPTARCCDTTITSAASDASKRLAAAGWQHAQGGCQPVS
jgi:hypothetical protein